MIASRPTTAANVEGFGRGDAVEQVLQACASRPTPAPARSRDRPPSASARAPPPSASPSRRSRRARFRRPSSRLRCVTRVREHAVEPESTPAAARARRTPRAAPSAGVDQRRRAREFHPSSAPPRSADPDRPRRRRGEARRPCRSDCPSRGRRETPAAPTSTASARTTNRFAGFIASS